MATTTSNNTLLKVTNLKVAYGGIQAVKGVSFEVKEGELVSLIGANGAGKTTTLKAITGIQPVADGEIQYLGQAIKGQGAWDLVKQGLVMVPEGRGTFTRMTITENLQMGAYIRKDKEIDSDIERIFGIFPRLKERRNQLAGTMSGGEQQMLAMGRALMTRPKVLLLDEPSMGLSPIMVDKIFEVVNDIHGQGVTVLLVEQNASRALQLANRGYVMESGEVTMTGAGKDLLNDPKVRAAYLGEVRLEGAKRPCRPLCPAAGIRPASPASSGPMHRPPGPAWSLRASRAPAVRPRDRRSGRLRPSLPIPRLRCGIRGRR